VPSKNNKNNKVSGSVSNYTSKVHLHSSICYSAKSAWNILETNFVRLILLEEEQIAAA